ncbi:DUF2851 family protein [Robertkochia aurantiaca]|uniref:DUF2851 family protein n=1 Tax=Robertkochia aurantiaca TaxID=2873700 RepID=UPI001CCD0C44
MILIFHWKVREDFLHFIWERMAFNGHELHTTNGVRIRIFRQGVLNHDAGPDFFDARIEIGDQLWAGNIEIHDRSSDWLVHGHQHDSEYDNVILHVVWQHNREIYDSSGNMLPVLQLQDYVPEPLLKEYRELFERIPAFINCEKLLPDVPSGVKNGLLEQMSEKRLARKAGEVTKSFFSGDKDWEALLFKRLLYAFGLKVNAEAFASLGENLNFRTFRKVLPDRRDMEALLYGTAQMLPVNPKEDYTCELSERYAYLNRKFSLQRPVVIPVKYMRMRPESFPTIRISQFCAIYACSHSLFFRLIESRRLEDVTNTLQAAASGYWNDHYVFERKTEKSREKRLSPMMARVVVLNAVIPVMLAYGQYKGNGKERMIKHWLNQMSPESNSVIRRFASLKMPAGTAAESQALLELYNTGCRQQACLQCKIGTHLIGL